MPFYKWFFRKIPTFARFLPQIELEIKFYQLEKKTTLSICSPTTQMNALFIFLKYNKPSFLNLLLTIRVRYPFHWIYTLNTIYVIRSLTYTTSKRISRKITAQKRTSLTIKLQLNQDPLRNRVNTSKGTTPQVIKIVLYFSPRISTCINLATSINNGNSHYLNQFH